MKISALILLALLVPVSVHAASAACYAQTPTPCNGGGSNCAVTQNPASVMSNTCGNGGYTSFILTTVTAIGCGIIFTSACDNHDACYGKCGAAPVAGTTTPAGSPTQAGCDNQFLTDMQNWCVANYSTWNPCYNACISMALAYYGAVNAVGSSNFAAAQSTACLCYPSLSPTPTATPIPTPTATPTVTPVAMPVPTI